MSEKNSSQISSPPKLRQDLCFKNRDSELFLEIASKFLQESPPKGARGKACINKLQCNHFFKIYFKVFGERQTDESLDLWVGVCSSRTEAHVTALKGVYA